MRRTKPRRTRPKRKQNTGGISPPNRTHSKEVSDGDRRAYQVLRDIHEQRTQQAQITDEALYATLAPTPEHWIKYPDRYDIYGIDYPETEPPSEQKPPKPSLQDLKKLHTEAAPEKPRTDPKTGQQPTDHWLPPQLKEELVKEWHRPEEEKTGIALIKYFTPDSSATWYLSEYVPESDVFYGWCDLGTGQPELGYVSRKELRETRGKMGLPIERDYYYTPKPLAELQGKPTIPEGYTSIANQKKNANHILAKKKGTKWEPHQQKAQPIVLAITHPEGARATVTGDKVLYEGLDPSHVSMIKLEAPNILEIPDGKYQETEYNLDKRQTVYKYPKEIQWNNQKQAITIENMAQQSIIQYKKVTEYDSTLPNPRINFTAKTTLDIKELQNTANLLQKKNIEHIKLNTKQGKLVYETLDEEHPHTGETGEIIRLDTAEVQSIYNTERLSENLERLIKSGFTKATLEYATDMPLKITATRNEGKYTAELWLAPLIGV